MQGLAFARQCQAASGSCRLESKLRLDSTIVSGGVLLQGCSSQVMLALQSGTRFYVATPLRGRWLYDNVGI